MTRTRARRTRRDPDATAHPARASPRARPRASSSLCCAVYVYRRHPRIPRGQTFSRGARREPRRRSPSERRNSLPFRVQRTLNRDQVSRRREQNRSFRGRRRGNRARSGPRRRTRNTRRSPGGGPPFAEKKRKCFSSHHPSSRGERLRSIGRTAPPRRENVSGRRPAFPRRLAARLSRRPRAARPRTSACRPPRARSASRLG